MSARTLENDTPNQQRRNGIIACIIAAIAIGSTVPSAYEPFTRSTDWQVYANLLSGVIPTLAWLVGLVLVWRHRVELGVQLGLVASLIAIPATSYWIDGVAIANAVAVGVGATIIAGVCLRGTLARWYIAAGILGALASIAIDSIAPHPRLVAAQQDALFLNVVVVLSLVALAAFLFLQFPRYSLRTKLVIVFVGLALVSTLTITVVATEAIRNSLTANAARDLRTRAQSAALSIGITMDRNVDRFLTLSLDKSVQDDVTSVTDTYPVESAQRDEIVKASAAIWAADDPNSKLVQDALNGELAYSLRQFGDVFLGNRQLLITDAYGSIIAANEWQPQYNFHDELWWKVAYSGGKGDVFIGQPEFNPMINETGVRIAIPIYAPGRARVVGVVQGIYTLTALQRALLLNSFGQTGKIDLLFPQGQILTSENTFRPLTAEEFDEVKAGLSEPLATLNYRGTPLLSAQGIVGVSDEQPEPYLRSSAWRTIATLQEEEALGAVEAGARAALIAGLITTGLAILAALILAQLLTRPIRRLTVAAEQVQAGDLTARAPVVTGDEIGTLAKTFNNMTSRLQDTLAGLERRVSERTQELSDANLSLQSNSAYLSALSDTSAGLFERLNLKELLQAIVERAGALVGTQNGFVFFAEPGEDEIQMRVGSGLYDDLVGTRAQRGVGLAGTVWQTGEPLIIDDYQTWEGRLPGSRRDALRAIVAVPLKHGTGQDRVIDETVGVIGLAYNEAGRKFGKTEVEVLQRFAQLAAIALDNAELYANSENRVQELAALNTISQLIGLPYNVTNVVERIGDQIRTIFDSDFGYFAILNRETNLVEFPYVVDDGKRLEIEPKPLTEGLTGQIITTGQPILLSHATAGDYERLGAVDSGDGTSPHSLLAVPIRSGDTVIGALSVQRVAQDRPFNANDQRLLTTISASIGVGLQNAQLAAATQRQVAELSALNRIGTILNSTEPLTTRVRQVGLELVRIFNVSSVYISLYDAARNLIEMPFYVEDGEESVIAPRPFGRGLVSHILKTREHLLINDHMQEKFEELGGTWIGSSTSQTLSYLGTPLIAGDEVLGVVALNDRPEGRFTSSDVTLMATISGAVASAIQNERLAQATQRRLAELAALNTISAILTSDEPLTERLARVGRELHTIFGVQSVYLALYDAATNQVRMPFFMGENREFTIEPFLLGPGFTSHIITSREPLLINDNMAERMQELDAMNAGEGDTTQSYLGVPIALGDQILGVVALSDMPRNKFQDSDVRLLETIAASVGTAIQNTRLLEQTQERARELDAVNSLAREITQQRSLDDLFQEVYLQVKSVSMADGLLVSLYDDRTDRLTVPFVMDEGKRYEITPEALEFERAYIDQVRMGEPLMINSTPAQVAELDKHAAVTGSGRASRSRLYVPLMAGVRILGMISLHSYEFNAYTDRDVSVLSGLASHIAVALENARLFEQTQNALGETDRLYRIAEAANTTTDESEFYQRVHEIVADAMPAKNFFVAMYNAGDGSLDMEYYVDEHDALPELPSRRLEIGTGITAYVLRTHQPLMVNKEEFHAMAVRGDLELHGSESEMWLGVPMMRGDTPIGVVAVQTYDPAVRYTERDKQTLINLSQGIANAIERKRAEEGLRRSEAQLAETMRITRLGNWEFDVRTDTFTFTDQFYDMMRTTAQREGGYQMTSRVYAGKFVHPEDMALVGQEVGRAIATPDQNYEKELDHRVIFGDGQPGYVTVRIRVVKDAQNHTVKTYGANLDITDRKTAEEGLRRSESQLAETMKITRLGNWEYDVASDTFTFTDQFYDMMRTTVEREGGYQMTSGAYAGKFVHPEDMAMVGGEVVRAIQTTDPNYEQQIDHRVIFGDGQPGYVTVRIRVVKDAENRTVKTYGANLDITDRKRAETELQVALSETQRLAAQARDSAEQVTALNRRLTREGWREYLDQMNSYLVAEAGGSNGGDGSEGNGAAHPLVESPGTNGGSHNGGYGNGHNKIRVPIHLRGEVIGEIELEPEEEAAPMSDEDMGLVTHVAENIGLALDNARLFTETQRRVTELDALNSISQAVTTELELANLLNVIGDQMQEIFDVKNVYIALYDRDSQQISLPYFVDGGKRLDVAPIPFGEGITSQIIRSRKALVINNNTTQEMADNGAKVVGTPARSFIGVPIFVGDEVTGVISIQNTQRENAFDDSNVRLLETIAATVGASIQNASLYGAMQQEVVVRQRAEEEIKLSLKEKEVLLKEIHHRVKNNLQIITSLLNLQSAQLKDPEAIVLFRESQARVRSMALIHEKLYQSKDLARIDFDGYVRDLMVYLFRSYAANPEIIRIHISTANMFLGIDTAIPCGLIISELVTNTIKYAFPNGKRGDLWISLEPEDDGHLTLLVKDNGVGWSDDFAWRESDSLGLQLVDTLSSQLHGTIEVSGKNGTSFKITFPG